MAISASIVCGEKLRQLKRILDDRPSDEGGRELSGALRLLLCDGKPLISRAWEEQQMLPPNMSYPCIKDLVSKYKTRDGVFLFTGAGPGSQLGIHMLLLFTKIKITQPLSDDEIRQLLTKNDAPMYRGKLSRFIDAPCCILGGIPVKRSSLIRFVANHMGGVHHGQSVDKAKAEYVAMDNLLKSGIPDGPVPGSQMVFGDSGVNAIYYEIYATADILVREAAIGGTFLTIKQERTGWPPSVES